MNTQMCWHKENDNEGICKACGAKAAIKLPFSPENVKEGRVRAAESESMDMPRFQDATAQDAKEVSLLMPSAAINLYSKALRIACKNDQVVGEKCDYFITLAQLEELLKELAASTLGSK